MTNPQNLDPIVCLAIVRGHLSLGVLLIVPVQDGGGDQEGHHDWANEGADQSEFILLTLGLFQCVINPQTRNPSKAKCALISVCLSLFLYLTIYYHPLLITGFNFSSFPTVI